MIIDRFARLDESKRVRAAVLAVVVMSCICYYVIIRGSVVKLQTATAKYNDFRAAYAGTKNQQTDFVNLQEQLKNTKKQIRECRQRCFNSEQALQFFESINAMALAHNLRPISRVISKPESPFYDDKARPQQQFLKTQSAGIIVSGDYFDIIDFMNDLVSTEQQQKVYITNMHITLAQGEKFYPKASFNAVLLIDSSESEEK
jgi:Tfp pilus assembly protein PilO